MVRRTLSSSATRTFEALHGHRGTAGLFVLFAALLVAFVARAQPFDTKATEAYVIEEGSGTVLLSKDPDQPVPPASMAKMMTMAVVFDALKAGRLSLDGHSLDVAAAASDGPRTLVFRPHQIDVVEGRPGAIDGFVVSERRHGAVRRLELEAGAARHRIEVDVPADAKGARKGDRISVLPNRWWLFDAANPA